MEHKNLKIMAATNWTIIRREKASNQMNKLQNLTNRKKARQRQIRREEEDIMYQYLSAEYCPF